MRSEVVRSGWSTKRAWQVVALGLVLAASCWWLLAPIYQAGKACSGGGSSDGGSWDTCVPPTSLLTAGAWGYIAYLVGVPMVLAVLPLAARGRAWTTSSMVSATGLALFALLGGLSLGLPVLPGAACAVVGACLRQPRPDTPLPGRPAAPRRDPGSGE